MLPCPQLDPLNAPLPVRNDEDGDDYEDERRLSPVRTFHSDRTEANDFCLCPQGRVDDRCRV